MGDELLRILMTICSLGKEWEDPSKIPIDEIVERVDIARGGDGQPPLPLPFMRGDPPSRGQRGVTR